MTTPANLSEQVLALPAGAGAVASAGQTFSANPQTGTGSYAVPFDLPAGPAGITPGLSLTYSTHGGAGIAGLGWSLGLAAIERRTDRGVPDYTDDDTFTLQGDELLPVGGGHYRLRIEGRFARIRRVDQAGKRFWVVTERDGTRVFYGLEPEHRLHDGPGREAAWYPSLKQDPSGNTVAYAYSRDASTRHVRLDEITWGGCFRVRLTYATRPDPIRSARAGFETACDVRLASVTAEVKRTSTGAWAPFRAWDLAYAASTWTGRSLLQKVTVTGTDAAGTSRPLPALTFGYAATGSQRWQPVGGDLPTSSLGDRAATLLPGATGLPDVLETTASGHRVRQNLGDGRFGPARIIAAPPAVSLADPGTFLSDMDGDGWLDLVVGGGTHTYRGGASGWSGPIARAARPSVDLDDPNTRVLDLDNDGLPDVLHVSGSGYGPVRCTRRPRPRHWASWGAEPRMRWRQPDVLAKLAR